MSVRLVNDFIRVTTCDFSRGPGTARSQKVVTDRPVACMAFCGSMAVILPISTVKNTMMQPGHGAHLHPQQGGTDPGLRQPNLWRFECAVGGGRDGTIEEARSMV